MIMTDRIIRMPELSKKIGCARSTIYAFISRGEFPKPIPLGMRTVGWKESEVDEWIEQRQSLRDG
ncbi:AlpA family transcriptional regulator [Vibrio cholerae]|nr:AlpA family transcriptional regulator [Vibrio cholerae]EJL6577513.1 AlpA family transcriptional regulator [Vibrio cholerae]EJL6879160.1 AlpA family transcriptional regulator [Vibrio cholerae]EKF9125016.1 AlpA family transcriptional regulator [Vibrio cholerae]EKF9143096.1 AlpA family transcriptional regulator [Vibrio cholerae]